MSVRKFLSLLLGMAILAMVACKENQPITRSALVSPPTPGPTPVPIAQILSTSSFVGSVTCAGCHSDVYDKWSKSWHKKVIQDIGAGKLYQGTPSGVKTKSGASAIAPDANVTFSQGGRWKQRYIAWDTTKNTGTNSAYAQWDVATITGTGKWSPNGGETNDWAKDCGYCHVTGQDITKMKAGNYEWKEMDVGCESCHGPGSLHKDADATMKKLTIVHPDAMAKDKAAALCGRCHNRGQTTGTAYKYPIDYQLGDNLPANWTTDNATGVNFWKDTDNVTILAYQQHRMQYPDFIKSKHFGKVFCFDCHDQHSLTLVKEEKSNELCYTCHSDKKANLQAHTKHTTNVTDDKAAGSRCTSCHMVKLDKTVYSFDQRNHAFKILNPRRGPDNMPNSCMGGGTGNCHGVDASGNALDNSSTKRFTRKADGTFDNPPGGTLKDAKTAAYNMLKALWPTYAD